MSIYLCAVSNRFPENYQIGLHALRWGVEERYAGKIRGVRKGDTLVFLVGGEYRSVHRIESDPFVDHKPLWPPKGGSLFPHRIAISPPRYRGHANANQLASQISFMRTTRNWHGTVQGHNGVLNPRLTPEDLALIKRHLHPVVAPAAQSASQTPPPLPPTPAPKPQAPAAVPQPAAGRQEILFQFYSADLERALLSLLPGLGLAAVPGAVERMPRLEGGASHLVCRDSAGRHVVVHMHRGQAPQETLLRLLHDMSWVRQNLGGVRDVRGLLLTESMDPLLKALVSEVPNIQARTYRLAIELNGESAA